MEVQEEEEDEEEIFQVVEKVAGFPGGQAKLMEFLRKELVYPQIAIDNNVQGRVIVQFVVNKDGSIQDVKVARGVDPVLDEEAIRVVKKMPKWIPAEQRGKTVRSRFQLPVMFKFK
jgi:protein TonB